MHKAVGYIRVGSEKSENKGEGLDEQENHLKEYAEVNEVEIRRIFSDEIEIDDLNKRTGLNNLLEYCKKNDVDIVVINRMDILSNDLYIQLWIEKELQIYNIQIITTKEYRKRNHDNMLKSMYKLIEVFADIEKERRNNHLELGKITKVKKKKQKASGNCPIGYKYEYNEKGKDPVVIVDNEKAQIVKEIYELYINRNSLQNIADYLNDKGITTERGNKWSKQSIHKILTNDFYIGIVRFNDIEENGKHHAIISKDNYENVQKELKRRRNIK